MRRRKWVWLMLGILLIAGAITAAVEPTHVVRGFLRSEAFHRGRPTSYWREVFRQEGKEGQPSDNTFHAFAGTAKGVPVLVEALHDPEPAVRTAATYYLGRCSVTPQVIPALRKALNDADLNVRLNALTSLGRHGKKAAEAAPDIAARYQDPELQVQHWADRALWKIDPMAAREAGGWKPFKSAAWSFSVVFPGSPKEKTTENETPQGRILSHAFEFAPSLSDASHGSMHCLVSIQEYPKELIDTTPEEKRLDGHRDQILLLTGGKVQSEQTIHQGSWKGRERVIEVKDAKIPTGGQGRPDGDQVTEIKDGVVRDRLFWMGTRLYLVRAAYPPQFLIPEAVDFFFESFRIEEPRPGKETP